MSKKTKKITKTIEVLHIPRTFDPTENVSDEKFEQKISFMPISLLISELEFHCEYLGHLYVNEGKLKKNTKANLVIKRIQEIKKQIMQRYHELTDSLAISDYYQDLYWIKLDENNGTRRNHI